MTAFKAPQPPVATPGNGHTHDEARCLKNWQPTCHSSQGVAPLHVGTVYILVSVFQISIIANHSSVPMYLPL
jgi:hypothetical protein